MSPWMTLVLLLVTARLLGTDFFAYPAALRSRPSPWSAG